MTRHLTLVSALLVLASCRPAIKPGPLAPNPTLTDLGAQYERLRKRLERRVSTDPILQAPELDLADIVIGARTAFLAEMTTDAIPVYFDHIDLDLGNQVEWRKEGPASVKVLLANVHAGTWSIHVGFPRLQGILHADRPKIVPKGGVLEAAVPVSIVGGEGEALITVRWNAAAVAGLVCGDFVHQIAVNGKARPRAYELYGRWSLESDGANLIMQSEIDSQLLELHVDIPETSWQRVRDLVRTQAEQGGCGMVLDESKAESRLREFLDRGIQVRLPRNLNPSTRLPTQFAPTFDVLDRTLSATVKASRPVLASEAMWVGWTVTVAATSSEQAP